MSKRAPRGPRPSVKRATPAKPKSEAAPAPVIEAHGALQIIDETAPPAPAPKTQVPVESLQKPYDGLVMKCRKPFTLDGERYNPGEDVPVEMIPRYESWVRCGYLQEA